MRVTLEVTITMTDEQVNEYQGRFGLLSLDPHETRAELHDDIATAVEDALQHSCKEGEFWSVAVTRGGSTSGASA